MASELEQKPSKPLVYQEMVLHPELQQMLDECFTIVWPENLDKFGEHVLGSVASKRPALIDEGLLNKFPTLKVVSKFGVGYDSVNVTACRARGVRIGNTPDTLNNTTADMAFALLLATARRVCEGDT